MIAARHRFWKMVGVTSNADDHKLASKDWYWRQEMMEATDAIFTASGSLEACANLIRSAHPDRAQTNMNPARIAVTLQPAVESGNLTQQQVNRLVSIAKVGIVAEEFRDLEGDALDLSTGAPIEGEDADAVLDYYFEHAALGRVLMFSPAMLKKMDSLGELVLSPSFVVRAPGKKPRPILHLSSTEAGVNQRMVDDVEASDTGYTTIAGIAGMIVQTFVAMILLPGKYSIEDIMGFEVVMIVMDGDAAFFRIPVHSKMVGMQATRVDRITIVPLCCTFGWARSAEEFSHFTTAITAAHTSNIDTAEMINSCGLAKNPSTKLHPNIEAIVNDMQPKHSHVSKGHVDDFTAIEIVAGRRPDASAADLAWAIKALLGHDGLSLKKFKASSFWSSFQKVIGGWFDTTNFTITMPVVKIKEVLELLDSDDFAKHQQAFPIGACATLRGKMRWAAYATKLGDTPCLINVEKQRKTGESGIRKVKPWRHAGETHEVALAKFQNDLLVRRAFFEAAAQNPAIASCSMVSVMPLCDRLLVPGQSKMLVYLSGDFSLVGQSFGIEFEYPMHTKLCCFISHPPETLRLLREVLNGLAVEDGLIIMSSVLERQNKLMAEFMFRTYLASRPCICLEDNTGSVACINTNYSRNMALQAMQLASSIRQAVDEAPMEGFYCNTLNMSFFDRKSRGDKEFVDKMNAELDVPWVHMEPSAEVIAISEWLPEALKSEFPQLENLLSDMKSKAAKVKMPECALSPEEIAAKPDTRWQDRVAAAKVPIPHWMGSFGPMAYSTDHLIDPDEGQKTGATNMTFREMQLANRTAKGAYTMIDAFSGGCGASMAAIYAGLQVVTGMEIQPNEIGIFESLTGRCSLGDVDSLDSNRMPLTHILNTCSPCQDFSSLGKRVGVKGERGSLFPQQFRLAVKVEAKVVVWENVRGVATLDGGRALKALEEEARRLGYGDKFYYESVFSGDHEDPENRSRCIGVAFHDSVKLERPFEFPETMVTSKCAGEYLLNSTEVSAEFWDTRKWTPIKKNFKYGDRKIFTMGFMDMNDTVGTPELPSRVWNPLGLAPTILASGNSQLALTLRMRALCSRTSYFRRWANTTKSMADRTFVKGGIQPRRLTPRERLDLRGYPKDYPQHSPTTANRCAGNSVPVSYYAKLLANVVEALREARVSTTLEERMDQYVTNLEGPIATKRDETGVRRGYSTLLNATREQLVQIPVSEGEMAAMQLKKHELRLANYAEGSKTIIDLGARHWALFCERFNLPRYLLADSPQAIRKITSQAELFILYELAAFEIKGSSVAQKLWAVSKDHEAHRIPDPFEGNSVLDAIISSAIKKDEPAIPKVPVTEHLLASIDEILDLSTRQGFTLRTGMRTALAWLLRISEWAKNERHTISWKAVTFFDKESKIIHISSLSQLHLIHECELLIMSDKTHRWGNGCARSVFAMTDVDDDRCIVRDLARLWLMSEKNLDHSVFSWSNGQQGVTRLQVNKILKLAAIKLGIAGADISSHSLRIGGLCLYMSHGMPYEAAKSFGRWRSDCVRKYSWPSADLAKGFSDRMWDRVVYTRVRGGGAVQRI